MKKLTIGGTVAVATTVLLASACTSGGGSREADAGDASGPCAGMSVAVAQANPGYPRLPVYVARYGDLFADSGLSVSFSETDAGGDAAAALVGGSVDITAGTFGDVLLAQSKGSDMVSFAATGYEEISNLVIKKSVMDRAGLTEESSPEDKIKALRGLNIGVTSPGSSTDVLVRGIMKQQGLDPDADANIIPVGASAMAAAFSRNQIDALALSSPSANAAANAGDGVVAINFAAGQYPPLSGPLSMVMNTTPEIASNKAAELKCFADGVQRAMKLMREDPAKAKELAWEEFDGVVDRGEFDATIDANLAAFAETTEIDEKTVQARKDFVALTVPAVANLDNTKLFLNTD